MKQLLDIQKNGTNLPAFVCRTCEINACKKKDCCKKYKKKGVHCKKCPKI